MQAKAMNGDPEAIAYFERKQNADQFAEGFKAGTAIVDDARNGAPKMVGTLAGNLVLGKVVGSGAAFAERNALLGELTANGIKFNPAAIVDVRQLSDGRIVFLETGNSNAGLQHIIQAHGADFARAGIKNISAAVMDALSKGDIVGYQGKGVGRPIYQLESGQRIAITVGSNGFVVGANPAGR